MKIYRVTIKNRKSGLSTYKLYQTSASAYACKGYWNSRGKRWGHPGEPLYEVGIETLVTREEDWLPLDPKLERAQRWLMQLTPEQRAQVFVASMMSDPATDSEVQS